MLGDAFEVDFPQECSLMRVFAMLSFAVVVSSFPLFGQKVAATPPMGWNSWNHFAGHVTDADVRSAADSLVSTGMRDAGCGGCAACERTVSGYEGAGGLHPLEGAEVWDLFFAGGADLRAL